MADENKQRKIRLDINPETTPVLYTDNVNLTVNEDGVILNVCQRISDKQYKVVSRIGMSHTHAQKLVNQLGKFLMRSGNLPKSDVKN